MTRRIQKLDEEYYTREFLRDELKLNVVNLTSTKVEAPDCSATITTGNGSKKLLDVECTEYHVDNAAGRRGSRIRRMKNLWDLVHNALQLEEARLPVLMNICFKEPFVLEKGQRGELANELIRFACEFDPGRNLHRTKHDQFPHVRYPLLHELVDFIRLTHIDGIPVLRWDCCNVTGAFIGLYPEQLAKLIYNKSAKKYSWRNGASKWLLIYASGECATSRAGAFQGTESTWQDATLVTTCKNSVFDRIFFWERVRKWSIKLK